MLTAITPISGTVLRLGTSHAIVPIKGWTTHWKPNTNHLKNIHLLLAFTQTLVSASSAICDELQDPVRETEQASAATMAHRDHEAFSSFLSGEPIFFAGEPPLRGKQAVVDAWAPYFGGADAPF